MKDLKPILITGAERSGSSIVARCFSMCGGWFGAVNQMYENIEIKALLQFYIHVNSVSPFMPNNDYIKTKGANWNPNVSNTIKEQGYYLFDGTPIFYKDSGIAQTHPLWQFAFPDAKYIIVRRRTGDIIQSCIKTAYMNRFKKEINLKAIGVKTEEQGWLWWVEQYLKRFREMEEQIPNCKIIWAERMAYNDFTQMKEVVEWCGLEWNKEIENIIPNLLRKGE